MTASSIALGTIYAAIIVVCGVAAGDVSAKGWAAMIIACLGTSTIGLLIGMGSGCNEQS